MIGKQILHYQILEKLGEGGMGIVYRAEDTKLNRSVAIKVLPPHLLVSGDDRARFQREAKAAAALNHSNIATVYEINEFESTPFIVMEYIGGQTLNHHIEKGPLKLTDAISIAIQIAEGLKSAHGKEIVHRDIKSSNIILDSEKQAKILDFGLAKTSKSTKLTKMGSTLGTVAYMSPEQVKGDEVDLRSDLWSLGVVLYEMISGRLPFTGDYEQAIFYNIQNETPEPLTALRTGVPMSLEWIVNKLLAKDPGERYQSANDLIIDLKAVDISTSGFSRISRTTGQVAHTGPIKIGAGKAVLFKRIAFWTTGVFLIILTIMAVFSYWNYQSEKSLFFNLTAVEGEKSQILRSDMQVVAISPDGNRIAYCVFEGLNTTLFIKSLNDFRIRKVEGLGNVSGEPVFSPDGNWIAFNADGQVKRVSVASGSVDIVYTRQAFRGMAWGWDNTIVYTPSYGSGLSTISMSGGIEKQLTFLDSTRAERTHRWPQVLPGGRHVLFTIGSKSSPNSYEDADLAIFSLEDSTKHILEIKGEMARYIEPGYLIVAKNGKLMAAPFDLDTYKLLAPPVPVLNDVEGDLGSGISHFDISRNGHLVYLSGTRNQSLQLVWLDEKGRTETIPLPENPYLKPRISPDGTKLLVNVGTQSASRDIWVYNFERSLFRRLTFGMSGLYGEWSRDSQGIYYMSLKGNTLVLSYLSLKDGVSRPIQNFSGNTATSIISVSPLDKYLIMNTLGGADDWTMTYMDLVSKQINPLPDIGENQYGGTFSPDGKYLAYISDETGQLEVYITNFPQFKLKWQVSNSGGFSPRWSADGKKLYYVSNNARMMSVPITYTPVFSPGKSIELIDVSQMLFPNDPNDNYDISPDGSRFVMIRNTNAQSKLNAFNMIYNWKVELDKIFNK